MYGIKEAYIKGVGAVYKSTARFYTTRDYFKNAKPKTLEFITEKQLAIGRMQHSEFHSLSSEGSRVLEGSVIIPKNIAGSAKVIFLRTNLAIQDPYSAVENFNLSRETFIAEDEAMAILEKAQRGHKDYCLIKKRTSIPTNRFGDDERTVFSFGNMADNYGRWLRDSNFEVKQLPIVLDDIEHINSQSQSFINVHWVDNLTNYSRIRADGYGIIGNALARGVPMNLK